MKSFTITTTTTYIPLWIQKNFSVYSKEYKIIREKMVYKANKCFKCNHDFILNENIAIACFKNIGNKVLCQKCAIELQET